MADADATRVLIVGAGIAGLAVARTLRSVGVEFDVIDRREAADTEGAALLLTGNAVRVLVELSLGDAVLAAGRRVTTIRFTDDQQQLLFDVDVAARAGFAPFVNVERAALQKVLLDGGGEPVTVSWGVTVADLQEDSRGVSARLSTGAARRYAAVVGADGVHSQLRQSVFGAPRAEPLPGFHGWRFISACPAGLDRPQYMLGNGRTLLLHPLRGGKVYCGAGPVSTEVLQGRSEIERLRSAFGGFGGFAAPVVASVDEHTSLIATRYWNVEQASWWRGRCVLIGDAAHACPPTLAQGAALALEDGLVLGRLLGAQQPEAAMREFDLRRRARVVHAQSRSMERMAVNRVAGDREIVLRNAILARTGEIQFLDALAPLMEGSP